MRTELLILAAVVSSGCGTYADFRMPGPPTGADIQFKWEVRPDPVLVHGAASDVLNPSVVRFNGLFWNLYSVYEGQTWHTSLATSADPLNWREQGRILSPQAGTWEGHYIAANGSALVRGVRLWYWYQAGDPPRIGVASSDDGRGWNKQAAPVLQLGPWGSWDEEGLGDPYVIEMGGRLWLFYTGLDRAHRQRLGLAQSSDGVHWTKLRSNPLLEIGADGAFDEKGLGEPAVWASNGHYWMLYTGRDRYEYRRIGLAESVDGVHWQRSTRARVFEGTHAWNAKVVCDPSVFQAEGGVHVWFGGGDVARPDERVHGQIGYAFLRAVTPDEAISRPSGTQSPMNPTLAEVIMKKTDKATQIIN